MNPRFAPVAAAAALLAGGSGAVAQCRPGGPPDPVAVSRAIVGTVMDDAFRPLDNVNVAIRNPRRQARTQGNGRFQLNDLEPGTYEITVHRIGYETAVQSYVVTDSGGVARFCLVPEPRALPTMISSVTRPGLSGVVGDSNYATLGGAEVRAIAEGQHTLTDSAGGFYLPLGPGTYAVSVFKPGYGRQLLSVTVPRDSGRQIAVWLGSPPRNANKLAADYDSMRTRLLWARPNLSALVSSERIAGYSGSLAAIAQAEVKARVLDNCEAIIDGGPFRLPLYMIDNAEVALMEVYLPRNQNRGPTSINPAGTSPNRTPSGSCTVTVYVWMKP